MTEKEFIEISVTKSRGSLPEFPGNFLSDVEVRSVDMPGKTIVLGQELFGSFEIIDSDGNVYFQVGSTLEAKYYLYSNRTKPSKISVPVKETDVISVVKKYENSIDQILQGLEKDFKKEFPGNKNFYQVSNQIFHMLNLQRY
ncbi:MAG: hypothetical protein KKA84_01485 [Bacteroidetes bacterium]|nr:hypothetical protein [Bacteroidota bacterium]